MYTIAAQVCAIPSGAVAFPLYPIAGSWTVGLMDAEVIDVHAHVVLAETMGAAGPHGPELTTAADGLPLFRAGGFELHGVPYAESPFMRVDLRLQRLDAAGIDYQLLSPNPLTYFHHIEPANAVSFCRIHNDALASIVGGHPDRLGGFAAIPIQDVGASIEELHRAIKELGLHGPYIGTNTVRPLHDPAMNAFYQACVDLDVPLFLHPSPAGIDGPKGDPNLKHFDLDVVIGFAAQEAIAVGSLIYGGVLDRFPDLDICLSHGGGSAGYLIGRMAQGARKRPWSPDYLRADGAFEERFARFWFDNHLNNARSLDLLMEIVGDERLVYGTNFVGWDAPDDMGTRKPDPKLANNARRLLRV